MNPTNRDASAWGLSSTLVNPLSRLLHWCHAMTSVACRGNTMRPETSDTPHLTEQSLLLTEAESRAIMENVARTKFDMSLDEFREAWKAGEFDDDYERHDDVVGLAMKLPEYWND